jgi:tRNA A37 threonylcarbamoyladenosine dehydratase
MTKIKDTKDKFARFKDSEWFGTPIEVVIGGVGGIGSWLSVLLARTGEHTIAIYDMDTVESTNMAGQFYVESDIGKTKVEAVKDHIINMAGTDCQVFAINDKITEDTPGEPIMISCFDNMEARKNMFNAWKNLKTDKPKLYIDGRMNAENFQMFMVTPRS